MRGIAKQIGGQGMAIFHLSAKLICRSDGRSATAAAAYRSGMCIHDARTGMTFDYSRRKNVAWRAIAAPDNASPWVLDREKLWNVAEQSEKRRDAQVAREIEVAIPLELSHAARQMLIAEFVQNEFVDRGMVADIAVHDNDGNPHCHILLSLRELLPDGFGLKVRNWNDKQLLEGWRESWAEHCNKALTRNGIRQRIDHRTLIAQGIHRVAGKHEGVCRNKIRRALVKKRGGSIGRKQPVRTLLSQATGNGSMGYGQYSNQPQPRGIRLPR